MRLICATRTQASAFSMDFSQSFAGLRQPYEGALHTPSSRRNLEAFSGIGLFHGPDGPAPDADQRLVQFRSGIPSIGKDVAQLRGLAINNGIVFAGIALALGRAAS